MTQPPFSRAAPARAQLICLAGFMGSGKTTVGALLARQLAWRFVDLDERIEAAAGLRIPEIFERHGEPTFRQLEQEELRSALGRSFESREPTVLALGGGTYAQPGNRDLLRAAGVWVIWLDCPIEVLLARCATMMGRPLFRDVASFRALYAERLPSYQLADFRVESVGEPAAVASEILRLGPLGPGGGDEPHLLVEKQPKAG